VTQIPRGRTIPQRISGVVKKKIDSREISIGTLVQRIQLVGNQEFFKPIANVADRNQVLAIPKVRSRIFRLMINSCYF
jgi:hypothetical protein